MEIFFYFILLSIIFYTNAYSRSVPLTSQKTISCKLLPIPSSPSYGREPGIRQNMVCRGDELFLQQKQLPDSTSPMGPHSLFPLKPYAHSGASGMYVRALMHTHSAQTQWGLATRWGGVMSEFPSWKWMRIGSLQGKLCQLCSVVSRRVTKLNRHSA